MLALCQLNSCQKAAYNPDHKLFIKTFKTDTASSEYGEFIEELSDGGFIMISYRNFYPVIIRMDKYGNIISQRAVPNNSFNQDARGYLNFIATTGDPWHFLDQYSSLLIKFDTSGKISSQTQMPAIGFNNPNRHTYYGAAAVNGNGFLAAYCDGADFFSPYNFIYSYDANLNLVKTDTISDFRLGGHTVGFGLCPGIQSEPYAIFGTKYPRTYWTSLDNSKIFAARVPAIGNTTQTMIDTGDLLTRDEVEWQTRSLDSDVVVLGDRGNILSQNLTYPIVIKFDKNLKVVWKQTYYKDNVSFYCFDIITCNDGGFLITGAIGISTNLDRKPYVLKIDANGNKQWEKTFTTKSGTGRIEYGIQLADGGYALVGDTNQFGKGKNGIQLLFVRVDANGNL